MRFCRSSFSKQKFQPQHFCIQIASLENPQYIELSSALLGALSVWMNTRRLILGWPVGLISVVLASWVYQQSGLYAEAGLQSFYFLTGIYGWWNWSRNKDSKTTALVSPISRKSLFFTLFWAVPLYAGIVLWVQSIPGAALPWLDGLVTVLSIVGQIWLTRRNPENWWIWVVVNVLSIGLYIWKELWFFSGLYLLLLLLALMGLRNWTRTIVPSNHA